MKKAWLYWASFIVYPSGKHVFCVQVECDYYVVNVLSVLNISKWPFQWFLARWPSSFFHHFVSAKQQKTPTPFAPKKMQTWTLTQEMEMPVPNSLSFKPHAAKLGQLTGLRFRCCVWPPPFPQCFPWQLKLKKKKFILPICSSPKEWTVKCTETRRSVMKGKWSNPLSSVMPHKTIFTHFQNRYDWQQMTERNETEERFVIQKLHSIYIFSMQTSTPCDRPKTWAASDGSGPSVDAETSAWPHSGPVCMQRPLCLIIPYSWIQSPGDLWEHRCTELKINQRIKRGLQR